MKSAARLFALVATGLLTLLPSARTQPTSVVTILHSFASTDGQMPLAGLVQGRDGNFYGTTSGGGSSDNNGTVFSITPSGVLTTLYGFKRNSTDGSSPSGALVQGSDGNFHGTTTAGGSNVAGTIFRLPLISTLTPAPTVSVAAVGTDVVVESGAKGVVLVTRTGDTPRALTVTYKTKGAAVAGVDYKKLLGSVTIPAGASKAKIKIKSIDGSPNTGTLKLKVVLVAPGDSS